ncbi:MAG: hypothetical protein EZS28_032994 [Streblomastix strix]|uniref:Uncharacterized protein n=1 Tax=Streblomastix strix TaxID=222440 RepID=A0A5J4UM20_9EUKA|nr:MAG: hypothetical protein EZS28_032994 [Streblomastix strix]
MNVENDTSIEELVQQNIQKQIREDKLTCSIDRQTENPQTLDKRSVYISTQIKQSIKICIKNEIVGRDDVGEQKSNPRTEMVNKENNGQPTRVTDQQSNSMHVNKGRIITELGSNADIRESNKINATRLLEQKGSKTDKLRQKNQNYLLRATLFQANLQECAKQGNLDTLRQHNSSLRYLELENEGILDRKNKINSPSRLCRSGDYALNDGTICMICKGWNYMPQIDIFVTLQNSGDRIENEGQGSKTSTRHYRRLASGPVADVGRDLLMRYMIMR